MKIRIWADTHSTGIFNEIGKFLDQSETTISNETWESLAKWVEDYDDIITMDDIERKLHRKRIDELDRKGIDLLRRIRKEWPFDVSTGQKIEYAYYSEGLMKNLAIDA
jgi:hypothetical protein